MRGERVQDAARIVEKETHHGAEQNQKKHQPEQDRQRQPDAAMTRWCMSVAKSSVIPSRVRKLPTIMPCSPWVGSTAVTKPRPSCWAMTEPAMRLLYGSAPSDVAIDSALAIACACAACRELGDR